MFNDISKTEWLIKMDAPGLVTNSPLAGQPLTRPPKRGSQTTREPVPEDSVPLLQTLPEKGESPRVSRRETRPIQSFNIAATDNKSASVGISPVKFDCIIMPPDVEVDVEVDGLLDRLSTFEFQRSQHGETATEIHLIQSFEDLSKDNLRQRIHLTKGSGKCERSPGKLFKNNRPVRLVLDLQKMNPADTAALNDLLDPENPTLNKIRLGRHVDILVLVQRKQLHAGHIYSLGADTCRRINRVENTWDYQKKLASLTNTQREYRPILNFSPPVTDQESTREEAFSINLCHGNIPWRKTLFGSYGVKADRGFDWHAGVIERGKPKKLWITDAPDRDPVFTQALRNIKITREIEANGEKISLPHDITFLVRQSGNEETLRLLNRIQFESNIPEAPFITINSANVTNWLSTVGINAKGEACEHNPLGQALQAGGVILVTSSLHEAQWTQLLHALTSLVDDEETKLSLTLLETNQPQSFFPARPDSAPQLAVEAFEQTIKIQRSQDKEARVNDLYNKYPEAEIVRINPETTLSQLVNNAHIVSEARFKYGFHWSAMMKALKSNKPVILCGLEQNPRLQLELETLLLKPGHFLVNGSKEPIPADSRIHLVWPEDARTESVVWQTAIARAIVLPPPVSEHSQAYNSLKEGLGKLQSALQTLPKTFSFIKLPTLSDAQVQSVLNEANAIVTREGGTKVFPAHYRKAISTVVTHVARESRQVRAFAKSITRQIWPDCQSDGYWVDIDKLTAFLGDGHLIDRNYIISNRWELVDMFGERFFSTSEPMALDYNQSGHTETLIALLCCHAPKIFQRALKYRLECDNNIVNALPDVIYRSSVITQILNNALYAGWAFRMRQDIPVQTRLDNLSTRILKIQQNAPADQQQSSIRSLRQPHFRKRVGKDQAVLDQILSKRIDQNSRGLRKLARLKERIQSNKLITLEGNTGTGKSYLVHQAAKSLGPTYTLTIGPGAEESHLLKRWVWKQQGDDRRMEEQAEIILKWAKTVPEPGEMVTLVVDEANLAACLLDNVLAGIWSEKPHIFCRSEKVDISPQHRVVFTCNPGAYAGRSHQTVLQDRGTRVHYPPLSQAFLKDQVVLPALNRIFHDRPLAGLNAIAARQTADTIMALQGQLKSILPNRIFSPRDLTDVCGWMACQLHYTQKGVSQTQLDTMVWKAFNSVISHSIPNQAQESYQVLQLWFEHHYETHEQQASVKKGYDLRLDALYRKFCNYVTRTKPEFETSSQSVKSLMQMLAQDLDRLCLEHESGVRHSGRRATLVEGPAGRGKDATLKLLLDMWLTSDEKSKPTGVYYFNAGDCDWTELKKTIREAQQEGKILVVSELNMISSADLEGELNDVLTEPCTPGFHLFATTNPPAYSGRSAFSPALNDRFRIIRIDDYAQWELYNIARQMLPPEQQNQTAEPIAALHCYIYKRLQRSGQKLFPVCRDLQNLAAAVTPQSDLTDLFSQHYFLYMEAGTITKEEIAGFIRQSMRQQQTPVDNPCYDHRLCKWLFATFPNLDRPLFIQRSQFNGYGVTQTRELIINKQLSDGDAKNEIIKQVAQWLWRQETGMPETVGEEGDIESKALYILQQRQWFSTRLKDSPVPPSDVFKLSRWKPDPPELPVSAENRKALRYLGEYRHKLSEREIWERLLRTDLKVDIDKTEPEPISTWKACLESVCLPVATIICLPVLALSQSLPDVRRTTDRKLDVRRTTDRKLDVRRTTDRKLDGNVTTVPTAQTRQRVDADKSIETETVSGYRGVGFKWKRWERTFYGKNITNYRLKFLQFEVTDNGNIYSSEWQSRKQKLTRVFPEAMKRPSEHDTVQLYPGNAYGCHTINTGFNHKLFPLPSWFPREQITELRTEPVRDYEIFLDHYTSQHWIQFSGLINKQSIHVHYQVRTKRGTASPLEKANVHKVHHPRATATQEQDNSCHCPEPIRSRVNILFDSVREVAQAPSTTLTEKQRLVRAMIDATNDKARIKAAVNYCRQFDNQSYLEIKDSDDLAQILLSHAVGTCRHRAPVFKFIMQYFGITCRVVESNIHRWAEVWDGRDWNFCDLGGAYSGQDNHGYNDYFPAIQGHQHRDREADKNSLTVLSPEVITQFQKATLEGIKQGCELLSTCTEYDDSTKQHLVSHSLEVSLNQMAESGSSDCQQVLEHIEFTHSLLDKRNPNNSSKRMWDFLKSVLTDHFSHCIKTNVTNTGWCSVLTAFIVEKDWMSKRGFKRVIENLRQWLWIEANIPSLRVLANQSIESWYDLWRRGTSLTFLPRYDQKLRAMRREMDEDTVPTGYSETFETMLGASAKYEQWTDQPEDGVPDISRLLQCIPAYPKVASSQSQTGKSLFLMTNGFIDTRNQSEEIQTRFACYLYKCTESLKAPLSIGIAGRDNNKFSPHRVCRPQNTYSLKTVLLDIDKVILSDCSVLVDKQKSNVKMLENTRIKKMMKCRDLVVFRPEDVQKIYDEYIESLKGSG